MNRIIWTMTFLNSIKKHFGIDSPNARNRPGVILLKALVSIGAITALVYHINGARLKGLPGMFNFWPFAVAIGLTLFQQIIPAYKIGVMGAFGKMRFADLCRTHFISVFAGNVLPTILGNDIVRLFYIGKLSGREQAAGWIVIDRISGLLSQCIVLLSAISFHDGFSDKLRVAAGLCGSALVFASVILPRFLRKAKISSDETNPAEPKRSGSKIFDFAMLVRYSRQIVSSSRISSLLLISIINQIIVLFIMMKITEAFGATIMLHEIALITLAATLIGSLPVSISGWGIMEGVYVVMYGMLAGREEIGLAVSLGKRIVLIAPSLFGMALFLSTRSVKIRRDEPIAEEISGR